MTFSRKAWDMGGIHYRLVGVSTANHMVMLISEMVREELYV